MQTRVVITCVSAKAGINLLTGSVMRSSPFSKHCMIATEVTIFDMEYQR